MTRSLRGRLGIALAATAFASVGMTALVSVVLLVLIETFKRRQERMQRT